MASIVIRQLDDETKALLKASACRHGRSVKGKACAILKAARSAQRTPHVNLGEAIHRRFAALGGIVLQAFPGEPISSGL